MNALGSNTFDAHSSFDNWWSRFALTNGKQYESDKRIWQWLLGQMTEFPFINHPVAHQQSRFTVVPIKIGTSSRFDPLETVSLYRQPHLHSVAYAFSKVPEYEINQPKEHFQAKWNANNGNAYEVKQKAKSRNRKKCLFRTKSHKETTEPSSCLFLIKPTIWYSWDNYRGLHSFSLIWATSTHIFHKWMCTCLFDIEDVNVDKGADENRPNGVYEWLCACVRLCTFLFFVSLEMNVLWK